jgi:hypothetical protein
MALPKTVVQADRKLEGATAAASELLAELRWHWTLDESNPDRVSLREYAREVGRDFRTIHKYAHGHALAAADGDIGISEAIERSAMGAETEAATEAVAKARDVSFSTVRQSRPTEVRRVRDMARERVERHGGTIEEQSAKAADWIVRSEKAAERTTAQRRERLGMRFVGLEDRLQRVRRELIQAVNEAAAVGWGDEERELLAQTLAQVKALLELLDMAVVGAVDVDWDAELAGLEA